MPSFEFYAPLLIGLLKRMVGNFRKMVLGVAEEIEREMDVGEGSC